ncbi:histidinol-phosphatase [Pararhizobium sp. IMCC21322]|uniref:histidinol-phosphatase n=1 Tax=Pararhizobium sp. IMCC21322 TaxID=3067903 RepID=UPI002740D9B0|nr:histidinol-phosphatase [Pararhizobium sp. IMCC21322]
MHNEFSTQDGVPQIIREMADVAAAETLPHFRQPLEVENKLENASEGDSGAFDPVTIADKNAEAALRRLINQRFPDHGILGEEYGAENIQAEFVWVLDPIDGTRLFVSGLPLWGTLIALCHNGEPILGAMIQPVLGEIFVGAGGHAWLADMKSKAAPKVLATRQHKTLGQATLFTTDPALLIGTERTRYDQLEQKCQLYRYGADCYGYAMVASGFADLDVEAGLQIYDIAALIPIIEAAGGKVTTWQGNPVRGLEKQERLQVLATANEALHAQALAILDR